MDKCTKVLRDLNRSIDNDYKKLCDRYHNLELSHNRKKRALEELSCIFRELTGSCSQVSFATDGFVWNKIRKIISDALFCDGRERSKR